MNRCLTMILAAVLALGAASVSSAQITITSTDLQAILENSVRFNLNGSYGSPAAIDLGSPSGSSQNFDFTSIPSPDGVDTGSLPYLSPAGQPGASNFPTATLCISLVDTESVPGGMQAFVQYFRLQSDGFYLLGQYVRLYLPPFFDDETIEVNSPMRLLIPLPLTYGTNRTGVDTTVTDTTNNDFEVRTTTFAVDGWGELTLPPLEMPAGAAKPSLASCLRGTETEVVDTYSGGSWSFREKYVSVIYITADGTYLVVEQGDSTYTGGTAGVTAFTLSERTGGITDVRETSTTVPEGYSLMQNYPNPFNPMTTIGFAIPEAGPVRLTVVDMLGREVATLVDRQMPAGSFEATFDAANLPSGMYVYRLVAGTFSESRKLNVVK